MPGYDAKHAKDRKLFADKTYAEPIAAIHGGPHVLVTFAIEDGGRLGAHALALLKALATVALKKGRQTSFAYRAHAYILYPYVGLHVGPTMATTLVHVASPRHFQACREAHVP